MISLSAPLKKPVILLANGEFPVHHLPKYLLDNSETIICTDGATDKLIKYGLEPTVTIGDLDSTKLSEHESPGLWVPAPDQIKTDLQKALDWCIINNIIEITILGAGGIREDHALGNLHILAEYQGMVELKMVTNHATINCEQGNRTISSQPGQAISIIAIHPVESITVSGLKYPMVNQRLLPSSRATCNEALNHEFSLDTSGSVWLFMNHTD